MIATLMGVPFVTVTDLAASTGLSREVILGIARREGMTMRRIGRNWFVRQDEFAQWEAANVQR
jgi:hypothetical protein